MHRHELRQFTAERLEVVREQWRQLAGEDEFDVELAPLFEWCTTHLSPQTGDSQARELHHIDRDQTDAILEVVDNKRGAKLLKLYLSPEFWAIDTPSVRTGVARLHATAFVQVIRDGIARGAPLVKIYGRSNLMLSILQDLQTQWASLGTDWDAAMQGRWLAISLGN